MEASITPTYRPAIPANRHPAITLPAVLTVAVHPRSEVETRAAYALAGHPAIGDVGLVGTAPPNSWKERIRKVASSDGFDAVLSGKSRSGMSVYRGGGPHSQAVTDASPAGLARALLNRVEDGVALVAMPGIAPRQGQSVHFPDPVGKILIGEDYDGVPMGRCDPPWAGAAAVSLTKTVAVIDDHRYLAAACLAAAALIASLGPGPVWERPGAYIDACEQMGLVVAEAAQPR